MRPALIVIISDRLPGTISNPHHLSCRQVHRRAGDPWLPLLESPAVDPTGGCKHIEKNVHIYCVCTFRVN